MQQLVLFECITSKLRSSVNREVVLSSHKVSWIISLLQLFTTASVGSVGRIVYRDYIVSRSNTTRVVWAVPSPQRWRIDFRLAGKPLVSTR